MLVRDTLLILHVKISFLVVESMNQLVKTPLWLLLKGTFHITIDTFMLWC